ncbi:MAG: penicillin-binding protein activator [Xanthomonadales bacterium]|nr:penicillin-binding protein activator [Xanthomonadales bacterium]
MPGEPIRIPPGGRSRAPRLLLAGVLGLLMAACATLAPGPEITQQAQRAEQAYRDGDFDRAASSYLDLARSQRGAAASYYRLRAAEALRQRGDLAGASRALEGVNRRHLDTNEAARLSLLEAEIALHDNDPARSRALLARMPAALPPELAIRRLELGARGELAMGDRFAAARLRAALDGRLRDPDRSHNRGELIAALAEIDTATLASRAEALPPDDPVLPWIEQVLRRRGQPLARELPRAERPVGTLREGAGGALQAEGYRPPGRIALLLPLDGNLAPVAQSIRDGFLAAWFNDPGEQRPELRIHSSGNSPESAIAAYRAAVAEGAERVVGPLQREAVGALFHEILEVPVLALNHPDTGEAPPPGSAEFGLLPEAEGAQVARHMQARGILRAAIIAADADWAQRAAHAFRAQFEAGGGSIAGETRLPGGEVDFGTAIVQATATLGTEADAGVFISMRPQQARILVPQLRLAEIDAPVFATSHINSGDDNPALDRDLDGVEFCDAPWLFGPLPGRPDRSRASSQLDSARGVGARLFAFGMDAYALLPYLDWLLGHPDAYLEGATGDLSADAFGRIRRSLGWARFENGIARPVDGALSAQPVEP